MLDCAVFETLEKEKETLFQLARDIWAHPETAYNEVRACAQIECRKRAGRARGQAAR